MAGQVSASTGAELHEQLALLSTTSAEAEEENDISQSSTGNYIGILDLSDEVLLLILRKLDPTSLLRLGATCCTLFRVCSCNSLWTKHFQVSAFYFINPYLPSFKSMKAHNQQHIYLTGLI
jgi:hypothetical protein